MPRTSPGSSSQIDPVQESIRTNKPNRNAIASVEDSYLAGIEILDNSLMLARFSDGLTVAVELKKFRQLALRRGKIIEWDLP
jgi:hypothetical protein